MAHLWIDSDGDTYEGWEPVVLSEELHSVAEDGRLLAGHPPGAPRMSAVPWLLTRCGMEPSCRWVLLAGRESTVRVNGHRLVAGMRVLRDRDEILSRCGTSGTGQWSVSLGRRPRLTAAARLSGQWLTLRATPRRAATPDDSNPENLLQLLRYNGALAGGAKFSLAGPPDDIHVSADIPLDPGEDANLDRLISRAIAGLKQAATLLGLNNRAAESRSRDQAGRSGGKDGHGDQGQSFDLKAAFEQVGWPVSQRSGGQLVLQLDVPGEFCQALVETGSDNAVRLVTLLGDLAEAGGHGQWAQAAFLLEAAHWVRSARPVVVSRDTKAVCQWQCLIDAPAAWHLERALGALSVACRVSVREWQALADESIARKYLAMRGWLQS